MTHTKELQKTQEAVKRAVNEGRMTEQEGIKIVLNKTIELLQSLKVPEGFTTEEQFMKEQTMHGANIN
jgi:hypothetical protein